MLEASSEIDPGAGRGYRLVALIIASALFMEFFDATVLATALPTMARDFGVRAPQMSIALTAYLLALAVFIPASAAAADRFGARRLFRVAIAVFMAGSLACALAGNMVEISVARFLQGSGGAMMLPVGRLLLLRSVAKADLFDAMNWLVMPAMLGPILGPPVGGFIVTWLDWRWIFYINLPVGVAAIWLVGRFMAEIPAEHREAFDARGFALTAVALGCLLFGFEMVGRPGGMAAAVPLLAVGVGATLAYLAYARGRSGAILDLGLLRDRTFRLSLIAGSLTRITQGAQPFLLPLMMQVGFGWTAARAGMVTLAPTLGAIFMKPLAARVLRRIGFRTALTWNGVLAAAGYAQCAFFRPDWPRAAIFALLAVSGFSMAFQFTAYNTLAFDTISPQRMAPATSFYTTVQQLMLSMGICTAALALHVAMRAHGHADPALGDFAIAYWTVTALSLLATIWNARFAADAGAQFSRHRRRAAVP